MNSKDLNYGVGVLVVKDGKFLCGIRSDTGEITGPGGHIEKGETPEQAAIRETKEEFGITPTVLKRVGCLKSPDDLYLPTMVFVCTKWSGQPKACAEMACNHVSFEDMRDLDKDDAVLYPAFDDAVNLLISTITRKDGGAGSGNWGHAGRPGQRGGSSSGGGNGVSSEGIARMVAKMTPEERKLYDQAHADSQKAVKLLNDTWQSNVDTWNKASKAVKEGKEPVTATQAAKDHTIPDASKGAQDAYEASRAKEKQISKDLIEGANADGTMMYGLDFSVKTGKSVKNKIERKQAKDPSLSDEKIVSGMGDLVRYTKITEHDNIAKATKDTISDLKKKGYKINELDNKYQDASSDYKGVHIGAVSPSGQQIELQIHSKESMKVKETIHPMYDISRNADTPQRVKKALQYEMRNISASMKTPEGIMDDSIKSWRS